MARSLFSTLNARYGKGCPEPTAGQGARRELHERGLLFDEEAAGASSDCEQLASTRIAVVGAGFAGLTAAWYLQSPSQPAIVTVFEASDRVGGRVETDRSFIPGKVVEAGAELIGTNHPMWWEIAGAFGLQLEKVTDEYPGLYERLRFGDRDLTEDEQVQLYEDMQPILDAISQDAVSVDPVEPWTHPDAGTLDAMSVGDALDNLLPPTSSFLRQALEFMLGNDNCAPVGEQSYLGLLALVSAGRTGDDVEGMRGYWECTETHRCAGGNDQLATALAGQLNDVRLNTAVDKIVITGDGVGIEWTDSDGVSGSAGFDYVVLAAPPTSWPEVESDREWDPDSYTMTHGDAVKHLNAFEDRFWEASGLAPSAQWDQLGSVWEGTDNQPWPEGGFDLSVFSGGAYVLPASEYPARLPTIFPGYAPYAVRFVDWPARPWIGTGYSVPAPGEVTSVAPLLAEPFAERLYFAGEQSYVPFFGYMEGALQSGARAGRELLATICPEVFG